MGNWPYSLCVVDAKSPGVNTTMPCCEAEYDDYDIEDDMEGKQARGESGAEEM